MKKMIFLGVCVGMLSACSMTTREPTSLAYDTLSNGKPVTIGWKIPDATWQCKEIADNLHTYNWNSDQFKGMINFNDGYHLIQKDAVHHADMHGIQADYIGILLPNGLQIGSLKVSSSKARFVYYHCKTLPREYKP